MSNVILFILERSIWPKEGKKKEDHSLVIQL